MTVGVAQPLGATPTPNGVNFSVYSEHATSVTLLLFASHRAKTPEHEIVLNARDHKSFHFWHCHVAGVGRARSTHIGWTGFSIPPAPGFASTATRC